MTPMTQTLLDESYDEYPRIEEAFQAVLDESLHPRSPEMLYEIVSHLDLRPGTNVLDLGCGEGQQALKLARDFGFTVHGIDPVGRHIEIASEALAEAAETTPELGERVRFEPGTAEAQPAGDASVDLIWCKDVLVHVEALDRAAAECRRVLCSDGRMLIYHSVFWTNRMHPDEAELLVSPPGVFQTDPQRVEASFIRAGFQIEECIELASEWGEWGEEATGQAGRRLLHTARLLRAPERYIAQFGQSNYDIMLGDCLWHVNRMIGKMSPRVYLLKVADRV
jgi:SAM-dependent methyltransferase